MWLFTKYGFFSVVCARQRDGSYGTPVDPTRVMVRARRREHLEALLARFGNVMPSDPTIHESQATDYRYRIFLPKATWVAVAAAIARDVEYGNFKAAAQDHACMSEEESDYADALANVWLIMHGTQP